MKILLKLTRGLLKLSGALLPIFGSIVVLGIYMNQRAERKSAEFCGSLAGNGTVAGDSARRPAGQQALSEQIRRSASLHVSRICLQLVRLYRQDSARKGCKKMDDASAGLKGGAGSASALS